METLSFQNEDHPLLTLPPIESHRYIIEWLFDVGPGMSYGMGLCPLTYQEINAWADGIEISAWERETLKILSSEYLSWSNKSTKKDCPAPYQEDRGMPDKRKSDAISSSLSDMFMSMANSQKKGGL